jgi:hypothetical protein
LHAVHELVEAKLSIELGFLLGILSPSPLEIAIGQREVERPDGRLTSLLLRPPFGRLLLCGLYRGRRWRRQQDSHFFFVVARELHDGRQPAVSGRHGRGGGSPKRFTGDRLDRATVREGKERRGGGRGRGRGGQCFHEADPIFVREKMKLCERRMCARFVRGKDFFRGLTWSGIFG